MGPMETWADEQQLRDGGCWAAEDDEEPYCRECGGEDLAYIEQCADGEYYKCRACAHVSAW